MATFSQLITVTSTAYPTDPQVVIPFKPRTISAAIVSTVATDSVAIGIGTNTEDAVTLINGTSASAYTWDGQSVEEIWLRLTAGTTQTVLIAVED